MLTALFNLAQFWWVNNSYGTRQQVLNDWFGSATLYYKPITAGAGAIYNLSETNPPGWTVFNSAKRFLMWNDYRATTPNSTDYTIWGQIF